MEILVDWTQNCQSAKINSPPKFPAIRYSTCTHGGHRLLQLALVVFSLGALAHLLMRTLQLALCGGGACGFIYLSIYLSIYLYSASCNLPW